MRFTKLNSREPLAGLALALLLSACAPDAQSGGPDQGNGALASGGECGIDVNFNSSQGHAKATMMKDALMASFRAAQRNDFDAFMAVAARPYIQHSPDLADGWEPVWDLLANRPSGFSSTQMDWLGDQGFLDNGNFLVMLRAVDRGDGTGPSKIVDIMRFDDDGKYAEHWDIRQPLADEAASGRSETEAADTFTNEPVSYDLETEEANKQVAVDFLNRAFNSDDLDQALDAYVSPGYIQHNP